MFLSYLPGCGYKKRSYCPFSEEMKGWRVNNEVVNFDKATYCCDTKRIDAQQLKTHFVQHYQKCPFHQITYNFLTKFLYLDGIRHPSIYPEKRPCIPMIKEAKAIENTRLNVLVNMLSKHPKEFNNNGERVNYVPTRS